MRHRLHIWRMAGLPASGLLYAAVALSLIAGGVAVAEARAERAVRHLRDDASGGDCAAIGVWDPVTRTCTLTADSTNPVAIDSDGITLDGGGHLLHGPNGSPEDDGAGHAVTISGRAGVTVRNISITRFDYGVELHSSRGCLITGVNAFENANAGVSLSFSTGNRLSGNTISSKGADTGICIGFGSDGNEITYNHIFETSRGIFLHDGSDGNTISGNELVDTGDAITMFAADSGNRIEGNAISGNRTGIYARNGSDGNIITANHLHGNDLGLKLQDVDDTVFTGNELEGNAVQARTSGGSGNTFDAPAPGGGNRWHDHDIPGEGCDDRDGDGFCDEPYLFEDAADARPRQDPAWQACGRPVLSLGMAAPFWNSFGDYRERRLSAVVEIVNGGNNDAVSVSLSGAMNTGGARTASTFPIDAGAVSAGGSARVTLAYIVPPGTTSFRTTVFADVTDDCGTSYPYPGGSFSR